MIMQYVATVARVLRRPSSAFEEISGDTRRYLVPSAVIFAAFVCLQFYSSYAGGVPPTIGDAGREWGAEKYATEFVSAAASALLPFAVIFYVGKRLGGTADYKRIFSLLSHCMIPGFIGVAVVLLSVGIHESLFADDHHDDPMGLSPSNAMDFAGGRHMIFGYIGLFFFAWSVVLEAKAVKVANGFGIKKSFGIVLLSVAATYLFLIARGLLVVGLDALMS